MHAIMYAWMSRQTSLRVCFVGEKFTPFSPALARLVSEASCQHDCQSMQDEQRSHEVRGPKHVSATHLEFRFESLRFRALGQDSTFRVLHAFRCFITYTL